MMNNKKLLILGSDYGTLDVVKEAHKHGIYVVVTDTMETSPTKEEADEAWYISTTDIDALEVKCREAGIDGITYGASDFNINNGRLLCKRLGLPHYCQSDRTWEVATNKSEFKKVCKEVGCPIATDYFLTDALSDEELAPVIYPVVVKPVDKSGNRGMSYCNNKEELIAAYKYARSISDNPTIVVERQLTGPEFAVNYVIADGEVRLLYFSSEHHQPGQLKNMYSLIYTQSYHLKQYIEEVSDKVKEVFKRAGCRDGIAWVECMLDKDGHFYMLEMGHRYGGEMTYVPYKEVSGFNSIKFMIEIALGVKHDVSHLPDDLGKAYRGCAASYFLFSKNDDIIAHCSGIEEISKMQGVFVDIPKRAGNSVRYHASMGIIRIAASNCNELCNIIKSINDRLKITNKNGDDMFIYFDDFETVKEEYENGLAEFGLYKN